MAELLAENRTQISGPRGYLVAKEAEIASDSPS